MKKIVSIALVLALIFTFGLMMFSACERDPDTIRLCEVTHSIFYAPQYLAMALGYFEEEGLTIELSNGQGADNVMTALLTGEADIGLMGCEASIYVYLNGKQDYPKIVAQLTKRDGAFLVARNPMPNFDYSNLNGYTVLMGRTGGMPAMILQYILNNKGYTDGQNITMDYSIQFALLSAAFAGGTGDLVPLFEPVASKMVSEGQGYIVSALGQDSGEVPYTCYTVSQKYLRENGKQLEKFLTAVWRGTDYLFSHSTQEVAQLLQPYFSDTSLELIVSALNNYKTYDVWNLTPSTSETAFNRMQDIMENAGELSARVAFSALVDNTVANSVAKK